MLCVLGVADLALVLMGKGEKGYHMMLELRYF